MFTTMDYFQHHKSQKTGYYLEMQRQEGGIFSKEQHEWKWKKIPDSQRAYSTQFLCPEYMKMEKGLKRQMKKF